MVRFEYFVRPTIFISRTKKLFSLWQHSAFSFCSQILFVINVKSNFFSYFTMFSNVKHENLLIYVRFEAINWKCFPLIQVCTDFNDIKIMLNDFSKAHLSYINWTIFRKCFGCLNKIIQYHLLCSLNNSLG